MSFFSGNNETDIHAGCDNGATTEKKSEDSSARDAHENYVTQPANVHVAQSNMKTRDCGHRAGFDAFMTGYCMATYLLQLGKRSNENELTLSSLAEIANKLSLPQKDVPLQITRSHFSKPSPSHTEKLKRLREETGLHL